MGELVSQRAYAKMRGISQPAVSKAVTDGRIKLVNGKIDPDQADRDWDRNTDKAQQRGHWRGTATADRVAQATSSPPTGDDDAKIPDFNRSRSIKAAFDAQMARLEYQEKIGKLIPADEARLKRFNQARQARDLLLAIPDRIAPVLAGETDQFEVHRLLSEELRRVCEAISDASR